jgi:histidyl-tRNA synthetase
MKYANKLGAKYAALIGENEINEQKVTLKNMDAHEQVEVTFSEIADYIIKAKDKVEEQS